MSKTEEFFKRLFKKYYQSNELSNISEFNKREFGIVYWEYPKWEKGFWKRYLQFKNVKELQKHILNMNSPPADVYFSSCIYENPSERKNYKWADIPIEFDLDDFYKCSEDHYSEDNPNGNDLFCDTCYKVIKENAVKLKNILLNDFGINKKDIQVKFSGHRGMHFRIINQKARSLSNTERRKIVHYMNGKNVIAKKLGFYVTKNDNGKFEWNGPNPKQSGWKGRSCKAIAEWLKGKEYDDLKEVISKKGAKALSENKDNFQIAKKGKWDYVFPENVYPTDVQKIVKKSCEKYLPEIDAKVAIDTKRVFRFPNSAHHYGLVAKPIDIDSIKDFNVWEEACLYENPNHKVKIKLIKDLPSIKMNGEKYSGKKGDIIEKISISPASNLISKSYAKIVNA